MDTVVMCVNDAHKWSYKDHEDHSTIVKCVSNRVSKALEKLT